MALALFLKMPGEGLVESVFTLEDQRLEGGVAERLPDFVAYVFFDEDFFALFFAAFLVAIGEASIRVFRCVQEALAFGLAGESAARAKEGSQHGAALVSEKA
jgi:hypothetical protein